MTDIAMATAGPMTVDPGRLVSITELATWAEVTIAADDAYAGMVLDNVSNLLRAVANAPTWTEITIPTRAKVVALMVARRTYVNGTQRIASSVGPINERVRETAAMSVELSAYERNELLAAGGTGTSTTGGTLWVQPTFPGDDSYDQVLYLYDSAGSPIPYLDPAYSDALTTPLDTIVP